MGFHVANCWKFQSEMQSFTNQNELANHNWKALHLKTDWSLPLLTGFRREMNHVIKNTSIYFLLITPRLLKLFFAWRHKRLATVRHTKPYPIGDSPRLATSLHKRRGHCITGGASYPRVLTVHGWLEDVGKCWQTQTSSDSATYRTITARWQPKACNISTDPMGPLHPRGYKLPPHATVQGWLAD